METPAEKQKRLVNEGSSGRDLKTMVFTDMVGSTQLKQERGDAEAMRLISAHHQLVRELLAIYPEGREISVAGDSFFLAFNTPSDAVRYALQLQTRLRLLSRLQHCPLQDRIGIHVGEVFKRVEGDANQFGEFGGIQVDTCSRVMSLAGGNHILLTRFAFDNARQMLKGVTIEGVGNLGWASHGSYRLKGIQESIEICEVAEVGVTRLEAPQDTEKAFRIRVEAPVGLEALPELSLTKTFVQRLKTANATERRTALIGALVMVLTGWIALLGSVLDNVSYDLGHVFRLFSGPESYTNEVEFVVMDDDSLELLKQKSLRDWDRRLHAQLLNKLAEYQARAVVFDVVFQTNRAAEDAIFLAAMRKHGNVGVAVSFQKDEQNGLDYFRLIPPFDDLTNYAWCGLTESARVADLTVRRPRAGLLRQEQQWDWSTLSEELIKKTGQPFRTFSPSAWLNYYCPPSHIPTRPYCAVLSNSYPSHVFSNKVVFVGSKVTRLNPDEHTTELRLGSDQFKTPYSFWGYAPALGIVVNATSFLNLKRGDWNQRLGPMIEVLLIAGVGFTCGYFLYFLNPIPAAWSGLLLSMGFTLLAIGQMWLRQTWFAWAIISLVQVPGAVVWSIVANTRKILADERSLFKALAARGTPLPASSPVAATAVAPHGTRLIPREHLEVPDHQLIKVIGEGAYGRVWLAKDVIGSYHAVKTLRRSAFPEGHPYEREFHGIQRFTPISRQHPGLVQILHVGRNDQAGFIYYIMELADDARSGQKIDPASYTPRNLLRDLDSQGPWSVKEVVDLGIALADALDFLHGQGLIHRDIKPSNIIFVNGKAKLADIGLVTDMAATGRQVTFLGTEGYIAPEGPGTAAGDIFSLGKSLYVAMTGLRVQEFPELPQVLSQRPDVEGLFKLNQIVLEACEPARRRRYPSAKSLLVDLRELRKTIA